MKSRRTATTNLTIAFWMIAGGLQATGVAASEMQKQWAYPTLEAKCIDYFRVSCSWRLAPHVFWLPHTNVLFIQPAPWQQVSSR
jgi:hypothetical protein